MHLQIYLDVVNQHILVKSIRIYIHHKKEFVTGLLAFSNSCISFFNENKDEKNSHDSIVMKMNDLVKTMNHINDLINENFNDSVKEYIE